MYNSTYILCLKLAYAGSSRSTTARLRRWAERRHKNVFSSWENHRFITGYDW